MDKAIKKLEQKRAEWLARGEYHRRASMEAHATGNFSKRDEEQEFAQLAIDKIHGLEYAIEILAN